MNYKCIKYQVFGMSIFLFLLFGCGNTPIVEYTVELNDQNINQDTEAGDENNASEISEEEIFQQGIQLEIGDDTNNITSYVIDNDSIKHLVNTEYDSVSNNLSINIPTSDKTIRDEINILLKLSNINTIETNIKLKLFKQFEQYIIHKIDAQNTLSYYASDIENGETFNCNDESYKPILVAEFLININLTENHCLVRDIEIKEDIKSIGAGENTSILNRFTEENLNAVFDGNYNKIVGLVISNSGGSNSGLFAKIGINGEVRNLFIEDANISGISSSIGVLAGENNGIITNVSITTNKNLNTNIGSIIATAGMLVGVNNNTISNCITNGKMATNNIFSNALLGGIAGENYGTISNSYSTVNIITNSYSGLIIAGGLVGINHSTINNSYSIGEVGVNTYDELKVGGFIAINKQNGIIGGSFFDRITSGQTVGIFENENSNQQDILGISNNDIQREGVDIFKNEGWDFENIWSDQPDTWPIQQWIFQ